MGAIHSTKLSGNFGPKLNGSVRSNRKSFEKTGPPFEVVLFFPVGPVGILVEWIAPFASYLVFVFFFSVLTVRLRSHLPRDDIFIIMPIFCFYSPYKCKFGMKGFRKKKVRSCFPFPSMISGTREVHNALQRVLP